MRSHRSAYRLLLLSTLASLASLVTAGAAPSGSATTDNDKGELSVESVLRAYEAACSTIESYDLHVRTTSAVLFSRAPVDKTSTAPPGDWSPIGPDKVDTHYRVSRQFFDRYKFRNDLIDAHGQPLPEKTYTQVWDGGSEKRLEYARREGRIKAFAQTQSGFFGICFLDLYRDFDGNYTYSDFIRDRLPGNVKVERDGKLVVLSARSGPDSTARDSPFGVRLFLDPEKGLMPARIDLTYADGAVPQSRYVNELAEITPGVWAPVRSRVSIFVRDPKSKYHGQELAYLTVEVDRDRSLFNTDLDSSTFELSFPPGVLVNDEIRSNAYRVGAATQEDYLSYLAAQSRLSVADLQKVNPRMRRISSVAPPLQTRYMIALNILVVVAIGIVVVGRRLRSRSRMEAA